MAARGAGGDRVLVLIQLSGGNDGLNTVIPLEYYPAYHQARTNIAIPEEKVLRLQGFDHTGLHPAMPELQELFNDGKLSILQGVSYPQPNFSHFRATDIWLTGADSGQVLTTGWAGRYLDQQYPHFTTGLSECIDARPTGDPGGFARFSGIAGAGIDDGDGDQQSE